MGVSQSDDVNAEIADVSETERKRREAVWELFRSECVFLIDHLMVLKHVSGSLVINVSLLMFDLICLQFKTTMQDRVFSGLHQLSLSTCFKIDVMFFPRKIAVVDDDADDYT